MCTDRRTCSSVTSAETASNVSARSRSQQTGGGNTLLRHWSCAMRLGLGLVRRPAQVHLQVQRPAPAGVAVGVDHLPQVLAGALTVISPSAQSAHQRAVATLTAAPISGGGSAGRRPQPGPVDADQPVVADLLAAQQRPDDVDALAQPGVAHLLARPAGRR